MKTLLALVVALVAFLAPVSAQVQYLHSQQVVVDYQSAQAVPFEACTLAPSTPVQVDISIDVRWWYLLWNKGPAITGYQYGRGINVELLGPCGSDSSHQLCNNICSGPVAAMAMHESNMEIAGVPLGTLSYVTRADQVPTGVAYTVYGAMQDWPGFPAPWALTLRARAPWEMAHRTWASTTLKVTPL